jgi:hypothetical protein
LAAKIGYKIEETSIHIVVAIVETNSFPYVDKINTLMICSANASVYRYFVVQNYSKIPQVVYVDAKLKHAQVIKCGVTHVVPV